MMRPIWTGSLAFGLVNVPVKLYSATEDHDIRFHQVHAADGGRIRYSRVCELDGQKVEYSDIEKAYEADDGRTVVLTSDDFKSLPTSTDKEIQVLSFVPSDQIDPIMFDRSYLLEPAAKSTKSYVLLRETLEDTDRVAIVNFALRQKTRLAALRVREGVLVVQTLLWPDEVRLAHFDSLDQEVKISPAESKMARTLVDSFADDFRPEDHVDNYREELQQLIDAKLDGGEAFSTDSGTADTEDAEVLDLLAALQRSVQRKGSVQRKSGTQDAPAAAGTGGDDEAATTSKSGSKTDAKTATKPANKTPRSRKAASKDDAGTAGTAPADTEKAPAKRRSSRRSA